MTLKYAPGTLVQEKQLADDIGIGRTPVREAVQKLAACGMLQVIARKGLLVAPISKKELGRVIEARRVLERLMVVKAAERAEADQRAAIRMLLSQLCLITKALS